MQTHESTLLSQCRVCVYMYRFEGVCRGDFAGFADIKLAVLCFRGNFLWMSFPCAGASTVYCVGVHYETIRRDCW